MHGATGSDGALESTAESAYTGNFQAWHSRVRRTVPDCSLLGGILGSSGGGLLIFALRRQAGKEKASAIAEAFLPVERERS